MYNDRARLEALEAQTLAPYALRSGDSRGRAHPEDEPRYRTAFQRDRDRIVHAAAFRRLEYKTQVFVNDSGDYYRTRLTHTLEVAQIGRTIARALGANENLVETICLAHDLGHPPFGHAGEAVLNTLMAAHGGFNHNHQTYRVVTELERRYAGWPGLNLTYETLEGIVKHETTHDLSAAFGYDPARRGSLEAQIADAADELAYNAHDLDDGLKAGLLTPAQLADVALWQQVCEGTGWKGDTLTDLDRHHLIRELIGFVVDDLLTETHIRLGGLTSPEAVQAQPRNVVGYSEAVREMMTGLKAFLYREMFAHFRIVRMSTRAERFVTDLFETYIAEPRQLPGPFRAQAAAENLHRTVADYIASLTDRSAIQEYRRLFDPLMRP